MRAKKPLMIGIAELLCNSNQSHVVCFSTFIPRLHDMHIVARAHIVLQTKLINLKKRKVVFDGTSSRGLDSNDLMPFDRKKLCLLSLKAFVSML